MASLKKYAAHKHLDAIYEFWFQLCEHVLRACEPSRYLGFGSVRRGGGELYVNIKKIEAITRIEGRRIGESLLSFLRSSVNEQVAVKRWIEHFPCLIQLKADVPMFAPFVETIVRKQVVKVTWHKVMEAILASALTISDFVSDLLTIVIYFAKSQSGEGGNNLVTYAYLMMVFVILTIVLQTFLVSERSERALRKKRILAMNPAKLLQTATSPTKLTYSTIFSRSLHSCFVENAPRFILLGAGLYCAQEG